MARKLVNAALGAAVAAAAVAPCTGEIAQHRVVELEGYGPVRGRQWSGYIKVPVPWLDTNALVHYWLVENASGDPEAPTVSWFQGGPGGSSMIGLFTENGPFMVNDLSFEATDGQLRVFDNPYSWHRLPANMLYVEHPAPTGFSKCEPRPCRWNDTSQAMVSYGFMQRFFAAYPEFASQPFYMTGESYAGVLVPLLAREILARRNAGNKGVAPWSLRGIALGNACPGNRVFTCTPYSGWIGTRVALDFRYRHGMVSEATYAQILAACKGQWGTYEAPADPLCRRLLEDPIRPVLSEAGDTYDMGGGYFLYDTCGTDLGAIDKATHMRRAVDSPGGAAPMVNSTGAGNETRWAGPDGFSARSLKASVLPRPDSGEYYCGQERGALAYLNRPAVQDALHVERTAFRFQTGLAYEYTAHSLVELYRDLLVDALDVLQYSGDADPCVPYIGTERWVRSLELETRQHWAPWVSPGHASQPAGYLQVMHSYNKAHTFAFATVRAAGHMSPRYKPEQVLHLLRMFLRGWQASAT